MKIKLSELRRKYTLDYVFNNETITATYDDGEQVIEDTFDFSNFEGELVEVNTDIPVRIIKSAERVDGEMKVELMKPYGKEIAQEVMQNGESAFPFSRDWQVVG